MNGCHFGSRPKRWWIGLGLAIAVTDGATAAAEDVCADFPEGPVRWVVGSKVGGGYDAYSRLIEPVLEAVLEREVIVENVPGSGGRVGAATIRDAQPDGRTLGLINGAGLLLAAVTEGEDVIHPVDDLTILARVAQSQQVWATRSDSEFRSMDDVYRISGERKLVFGTRDVGSMSFANGVLSSHLVAAEVHFLPGYEGSSTAILGLMRGETDLISYDFGTLVPHFVSGDLRPLLQLSSEAISDHATLVDVAMLGGVGGEAERRSAERGVEPEAALADAEAAIALAGTGRLVVAPKSLPQPLAACLDDAMQRVMADSIFIASAEKANRSLDPARGAQARARAERAAARADRFVPILRDAIADARR